ncbi:MAG: phosphotransferase [Clostridia bacterium]|nr:phosphotransferase [Clostridia bacterium]
MEFVKKTLIDKGWSGDKKYMAVTSGGEKFLYRVSGKETYDVKKAEFEMMKKLADLNLPISNSLEFGENEDGVYSVQTWIEGEDAEEKIPTLTRKEQYRLGTDSGKILQKIHSIPAPSTQEDWETRFNRKMDRKIEGYLACPIKAEGGENFIRYINANRHLIKNRPQTFQHGDYHIGNMMINGEGTLFVIDFNRFDFGDPWEEFNRIVWCAQKAPAFAKGMLDGYFDGNVPHEFFETLALYISSNALSSVYWAVPFGEEEIHVMLNQVKDILSWYDNMNTTVPSWYTNA